MRGLSNCIFLYFLLIAFDQSAIAQRLPSPEVLTVDDGLCFRNVNNITQDHNRLLWFGTKECLSRFDGYRFLNFEDDSTSDHYFPYNGNLKNNLLFRNDSILWTIVGDQLYMLNSNSFKAKPVLGIEGRLNKLLRGINEDVWLVSSNENSHFLWHYTDNNGFKKIGKSAHYRFELTDLELDKLGHVWWSTMLEGVKEFDADGELLREIKLDSFIWGGDNLYHSDMLIDSKNRFFYYSRRYSENKSIWQYFPQSGEKKLLIDGFKTNDFEAFEDSEGNLWFAKEEGILQIHSNGQLTDHTTVMRQVLDFSNVNTIYEDASNVLWIGTDGGVIKLPIYKKIFDNYFSKKGFGWGNAIRGIGEDHHKNLFFFCETGDRGLYHFDATLNQFENISFGMDDYQFYNKLGLCNHFVFDSLRNCVWTFNLNLWKIDLDSQQLELQPNTNLERDFSSYLPLILLHDNKILLGHTLEHLIVFNPKTGQSKKLLNKKKHNDSKVILKFFLEQNSDSLWVGTAADGLYLFNREGEELFHFDVSSSPALSSNDILCLHFDHDQQKIWVGTFGGGLNCIDLTYGTIEVFNQKNGLPNNNVVSILSDDENLWIGTYDGLAYFDKGEESFQNFYEEDGLTHNEFNYASAFKSSDGKLHFGGMNGINSFHPNDVLKTSGTPSLILTRFTKHDQKLNRLLHFQSKKDLTGPFLISPTISYFQFEWTLPDFINQKKIQYFTWLEGLEEDWTPLGNTPNIRFNKLPPGEYTLHLKGKNSKGIWNKKPLSIDINVLPPWWKTWWAITLFALLAMSTIAFFWMRERRRFLLQNQLEKEHIESERLRELDETKTRLFANISHEFRTPLTIISGMAQQMEESPKQWLDEGIVMIKRNSSRLLVLVNHMLDLSKLESGKMALNLAQGDIINYLKYIVESIHSYAESKEIKVHFLCEEDHVMMDFDQEKFHQVVINLLSNAVKFTPEGGDIYVTVELTSENINDRIAKGKALQIKVKDTGVGIPQEQLPFIFDRFYQVDDTETRHDEGTGIGLSLVKELVKLMRGDISVKSNVGCDTVFTVLLPIVKEASITTAGFIAQKADLTETISEASNDASDSKPKSSKGVKPRILLVEDNADVVAYVASCLRDEYQIQVGRDGHEGIQIAFDNIPDLIITDVMMPIKDGFEVTNTLKSDERTSHIPIIMLTAKADMESKLEGLSMGADAYLAKPFHKKELLVRIENLLQLRKKLQQYYLISLGISSQDIETVGSPDEHIIQDPFGQKIKSIVESHIADYDFSVEQLCKEIGMSHSQLLRKLSALTGLTPLKFIRQVRLNNARTLLKDSETSVADAAFGSGFNDPSYFARVFKKEFGVTPHEWKSL